ncbi:MAG: hypothetical protein EXR77_05470 [Myxococcales bacterium]|nr:hypothetical protein [Myxococcales bacterium]
MRRKPSFTRADRVEHLLLEEVERLLAYEVRDPLAHAIKVTAAHLSLDLGHLRVQYVLYSGGEPFEPLTAMLVRTSPFLARTLQGSLQLRGRLQIAFHYDRDAAHVERVRAILKASTPPTAVAVAESANAEVEAGQPGANASSAAALKFPDSEANGTGT